MGNCCVGLPEIDAFIHHNKKVAETKKRQSKLLEKWTRSRSALRAITSSDPELLDAWQLERVSLIVDYAFRTHPYYNRLYSRAGFESGDIVTWADYHCLPQTTKQDIIEHFDLFDRANLAPPPDEVYNSTTSGSSGQVLTCRFDSAMIHHDTMQVMRYLEQMLGRERKPDELFYKIYLASPPFSSLLGKYPQLTVSNECPPELVLEHLRIVRPAILGGFPSYLERLSELVDDPKSLGLLAVNTNSEASTPSQRRKIAERLGAMVSDEYSSVEMGLIATQCRMGRYHIVEDNVRLDVVSPTDRGMGDVVLTSLINGYMPFIRYRQGDMMQLSEDSARCECGSTFRCLEAFLGRTDQQLLSSAIGKIPSDHVMALYDRFLLVPEAHLEAFQVVQKSYTDVRVHMVAANGRERPDGARVEAFVQGLRGLFRDDQVNITVEPMPELPPERSHKRRMIKCEIVK